MIHYMMNFLRICHLNGRNSGKIVSTYESSRKFQFGLAVSNLPKKIHELTHLPKETCKLSQSMDLQGVNVA